jgi:hypothetical protein
MVFMGLNLAAEPAADNRDWANGAFCLAENEAELGNFSGGGAPAESMRFLILDGSFASLASAGAFAKKNGALTRARLRKC